MAGVLARVLKQGKGALVLTGFMDALGLGAACEDRLGKVRSFGREASSRRAARLAGSAAGRRR